VQSRTRNIVLDLRWRPSTRPLCRQVAGEDRARGEARIERERKPEEGGEDRERGKARRGRGRRQKEGEDGGLGREMKREERERKEAERQRGKRQRGREEKRACTLADSTANLTRCNKLIYARTLLLANAT
jgi:hypothetical protein